MLAEFTEKELNVLHELAKKQELNTSQVLRQALRLYQLITLGIVKVEYVELPVGCPNPE